MSRTQTRTPGGPLRLASLSRQGSEVPWHLGSERGAFPPSPSYPENGVVQMNSRNVRARARHIIKWQDLEVGQMVMVNYNPDNPKDRGFWYDAEILRKRETRTVRELHANVRIG